MTEGELICSEKMWNYCWLYYMWRVQNSPAWHLTEPSSFELGSGICIANNHPVIVVPTCQCLQNTHWGLLCEGQVFNRQAARAVWNLVPSRNCAHIFNEILNYGNLSILILKIRLFFSLKPFQEYFQLFLKAF